MKRKANNSTQEKLLSFEEILQLFRASRVSLSSTHPYMTHIFFSITLSNTPEPSNVGIAYITGDWVLSVNPEAFNKALKQLSELRKGKNCAIEFAAFLYYHETLHAFLSHIERCEGRDELLWNIACDLEVNSILSDIFPAVASHVRYFMYFPERFSLPAHRPAEWYYNELFKRAQQDPNFSKQLKLHDVMKNVQSGEGVDELTKFAVRRNTAEEIVKASKQVGDIPESLKRRASTILNPSIPWYTVLRHFLFRKLGLEKARTGDFTFRIPSKKTNWNAPRPVMLPSIVAPNPNIAVIIDTSGSMSPDDLGEAVAETRAICKCIPGKIYIVTCDADIQGVEKILGGTFLSNEKFENLLVGGGGTNLVKAMLHAQDKLGVKVIIALTDGYSSWSDAEKVTIPTAVVLVGENAASEEKIPKHFVVLRTHHKGVSDDATSH